MDNTTIHPSCANLAHLIDLHLWRGAPQNRDPDRPVRILVNHGYVVGFSPSRLQPAWSAYRVAHADENVDYERPISYYDDMRLEESLRIGRKTFGKLGNISLNVGHMTPNEVINRQFGRLAQMENFLMSNMSPQYASLNQGVWLKLEDAIREIEDDPEKDHVWAIVGPVFGAEPALVNRGAGRHLPVPESYFCIVVDPHSYPYDTPSKVTFDCFVIPQDAPRESTPEDYPSTLEEIERLTNLHFFESWGRETPIGSMADLRQKIAPSRLRKVLERHRAEAIAAKAPEYQDVRLKAESIDELIGILTDEAERIRSANRELSDGELDRLRTIQHTLSWLLLARSLSPAAAEKPVAATNLITYKIIGDREDRLLTGARTACNFWNRFLRPNTPIVIRLDVFTESGNTIARAYKPWERNGIRYGRVEFNTRFLGRFTDEKVAGTIIHEIGHTLGIGWEEWDALYDRKDGLFKNDAVKRLESLGNMVVELDYGPGTAYSHWDEELFDRELMTGIKDHGEHVLPVTVDVMELFGHEVIDRLEKQTDLDELIRDAAGMLFSRQNEARRMDLDYFEKTELFESIPHRQDNPDSERA